MARMRVSGPARWAVIDEVGQVGEGAGDDAVRAPPGRRRLPVFDARVVGAEVGELEFDLRLVLEVAFFCTVSTESTCRSGRHDGQHDAGQAAAGATSTSRVMPPRCGSTDRESSRWWVTPGLRRGWR
jgi:hypothetical protein